MKRETERKRELEKKKDPASMIRRACVTCASTLFMCTLETVLSLRTRISLDTFRLSTPTPSGSLAAQRSKIFIY